MNEQIMKQLENLPKFPCTYDASEIAEAEYQDALELDFEDEDCREGRMQ